MARVYSSADIETDDTAERDAARRPESGAKAARAPTATVERAMTKRLENLSEEFRDMMEVQMGFPFALWWR